MLKNLMFYLSLIALMVLSSCATHKLVVSDGAAWLSREVKKAEGLQHHDYGFALYDPDEADWIYERQADKYYTPASNTKILTLYAAMHYLNDSTEALRYTILDGPAQADTLLFWGTGDPALLYKDLDSKPVLDFFKAHQGPIYYAPREEIAKYGSGWAWDDYKYGYQVEKSSLPVYGNRVTYSRLSLALEGDVTPRYFKQYTIEDSEQDVFVERLADVNSFEINSAKIREFPFKKEVPFVVSSYDIAAILSEAIGRKIELNYTFDEREEYRVIPGVALDTLYQRMMHESDNFIAEQLLLLIANELNEEFSTPYAIERAQEELFSDVPDPFQWYDGSGLSRYNLFTPRSLVWVLDKIQSEKGMDYIKEIFASGGVNGTIEDWYAGANGPYVFAKTGTLRNRHCLSGYLIAKSGKTLIFSFMNQNFIGSSRPVKQGMQQILRSVYEKY